MNSNQSLNIELPKIKLHIKRKILDHCTLLVQWSLHKYKCLWGVGNMGRGSSLQEEVSHTYTLRLN